MIPKRKDSRNKMVKDISYYKVKYYKIILNVLIIIVLNENGIRQTAITDASQLSDSGQVISPI